MKYFNSPPSIMSDLINFGKYQKLRETDGVSGFIVNVHDAINFDIDLQIPPRLQNKYSSVISNQYVYKDVSPSIFINPSSYLDSLDFIPSQNRSAYRCRLKGVGINQHDYCPSTLWKCNQLSISIKQLVDRSDGWVTCCLSDIDVFQRLLVDISIPTSTGNINLKDYLLDLMNYENDPIFYNYPTKKFNRSYY